VLLFLSLSLFLGTVRGSRLEQEQVARRRKQQLLAQKRDLQRKVEEMKSDPFFFDLENDKEVDDDVITRLRIIKSRGMAHSKKLKEFKLSEKGINIK
jgi:hypothetical protein